MRALESSLFSPPAAIFYTSWAQAHYGFSGTHSRVAAVLAAFAALLLYASIATWVISDARQRSYELPYDFGSLVFLYLWVFGLLYVFSTRAARGFIPIFGLCALMLAGGFAGACSCLAASILHHV